MENNTYYSQPQYANPYNQQPVDPNYNEKTKSLLTKAIVACALSTVPIGGIVAIILGSKNRNDVLEYINQCGQHTAKLKLCSCLSRTATFAGIGYTIFWAFYALYFGLFILAAIAGYATSY